MYIYSACGDVIVYVNLCHGVNIDCIGNFTQYPIAIDQNVVFTTMPLANPNIHRHYKQLFFIILAIVYRWP